jgi:integrase
VKLTKREIDRVVLPSSGQVIHWDSELKGFGLRVTPSRMTYIAQSRVNGRTVRVTLGRHGPLTPDQARAEARKCLGDMDRGVDRNRVEKAERAANITLEDAGRDYLAVKALNDSTLHSYRWALDARFGDWKALPLARITGGMVNRRFDELSAGSPAQANKIFRFLRALLGWSMWRYASDEGVPLMSTNPCDILTKLKRWNRIERRTRYIEHDQISRFVAAITHHTDDTPGLRATKDLCALLLLTGLREQEGCRLRWDDFDARKRVITIQHTKNHRVHTLPIGQWLADRLLARRSTTGMSPYIFPADNAAGHLLYHLDHVRAIARGAGTEFRLHDLRRTFAGIVNHHLERSLSAYTIKRLMNHSSGNDVTAGYIQHSIETLRQPMEMVELFVLRTAGLAVSGSVHPIAARASVETPSVTRQMVAFNPLP